MEEKITRLNQLKKEKNAIILAHYYVEDEIQQVADYVGDSYYLSEVATKVDADMIVFCGVSFMGESAKILNPEKKVIMPDTSADCPMAHMAQVERIQEVRKEYEDVAVVCYVNSSAELKRHSDVCVTSSNAIKIVKALPNKNIFFIPDENLGRYVAKQVPQKHFIFNDGYCHVHKNITKDMVEKTKQARPNAMVLMHPECTPDALELADYIGSTSGIIDFATSSSGEEFIVATELGVMYELKKRNPDKKFYGAGPVQICPNMKKITLDKVIAAIEAEAPQVELDQELAKRAYAPLKRMLELAK